MGEKNLYNPHEGLTGRDGGPYLDDEERRLAEIVRASKEGRKPDFDHMPATAGTPLITAAELVATANPASNPSQMNADPYAYAVDSLAKDESFPVNAFATRVETDDEKAAKKAEKENDVHSNPANATVVSVDDRVATAKSTAAAAKASPAKKAAKTTTTKKAAAAKTAEPAK